MLLNLENAFVSSFNLKLAIIRQIDEGFPWFQNFSPKGSGVLALGLYTFTCINVFKYIAGVVNAYRITYNLSKT